MKYKVGDIAKLTGKCWLKGNKDRYGIIVKTEGMRWRRGNGFAMDIDCFHGLETFAHEDEVSLVLKDCNLSKLVVE